MKSGGRACGRILFLSLTSLALGIVAPAVRAAEDDSLAASTGVPWNPDHPVNPRRAWERVILFPQRIATLPLSAIGQMSDYALLKVEETALVTKLAVTARRISERSGLHFKTGKLETRSGLGGSAILGSPFLGGGLRNRLRAELAGTTRQYNRTLLSVQGRPARLEYGYDWMPKERFYGIGLGTTEDSASNYAFQTEHVRASIRWAWNRDNEESDPRTAIELWAGPRTAVTRDGREKRTPSWDDRFPAIAAATLDRRQEHFIYGASFSTDWRAGEARWTRGWRFKVLGERYDRPMHWSALKIGRTSGAQFSRLVGETETGFSFMRDPRTLRFLVRVMDQGVTSGGEKFLLDDLAQLGSTDGLAGFEAGRFHDLDLLHGKITYVFPLVRRIEMDVHTEWGSVYSDVWGDAQLATLKNSYGFAIHGRLKSRSFGTAGMDFSKDQVRVRFSLSTVE